MESLVYVAQDKINKENQPRLYLIEAGIPRCAFVDHKEVNRSLPEEKQESFLEHGAAVWPHRDKGVDVTDLVCSARGLNLYSVISSPGGSHVGVLGPMAVTNLIKQNGGSTSSYGVKQVSSAACEMFFESEYRTAVEWTVFGIHHMQFDLAIPFLNQIRRVPFLNYIYRQCLRELSAPSLKKILELIEDYPPSEHSTKLKEKVEALMGSDPFDQQKLPILASEALKCGLIHRKTYSQSEIEALVESESGWLSFSLEAERAIATTT